jgi:uncharacterized integral membrane protein
MKSEEYLNYLMAVLMIVVMLIVLCMAEMTTVQAALFGGAMGLCSGLWFVYGLVIRSERMRP